MDNKDISIIGAGLGGLAISCLLASKGHSVTVFEKNKRPGGKINEVKTDKFRFDTGPSLLTMPFVLKELFARCGANINDYLTIQSVDPICRYFYKDGTTFTCFQDSERMFKEIRRIAPDDIDNYKKFLDYSATLYDRTIEAFLFNPLHDFRDLAKLNIFDFFRIDAFKTVSERIDETFKSPHLRQFFKRFATYNGSSPFRAPATLNVIPHVELTLGGYYIKGGMYSLIEALASLAKSLGVEISYDAEINRIQLNNGKTESLTTTNGDSYSTDIIISNSDASETYLNLIKDKDIPPRKKQSIRRLEPSCSGFVLLLGIDREYEQLDHHNILFSNDYKREFKQIFQHKIMPDDPTIYIADTSKTDKSHAPAGGSNLFVLVNAPYLSEEYDWNEHKKQYAEYIIAELEARGLSNLKDSIRYKDTITPVDFEEKYRSNKGSIYGTSSNSKLSAFMRPGNKSKDIDNFYLVGGSTHPGGGIPLVILSAFHALELIQRYEGYT